MDELTEEEAEILVKLRAVLNQALAYSKNTPRSGIDMDVDSVVSGVHGLVRPLCSWAAVPVRERRIRLLTAL